MWHRWFNLNFMKLWEYFLCTKKTKITNLFNNFCHMSCYCREHASNSGTEEKKLLNKFVIFVHKNQWSHGLLTISLLSFWALNVSVLLLSIVDQKALRFHQKYLNLCSEDERRCYGFGTTWGWVINDRISISGWTIPLKILFRQYVWSFF